MRLYFMVLYLFVAFSNTLGQPNPELDFLLTQKERLTQSIKLLNDSLSSLSKKISLIRNEGFINTGYRIQGILRADTKVAKTSERKSFLGTLNKGDTVVLYGYEWYQYLATDGELTGFISAGAIEETSEIKDYLKMMEERELLLRDQKAKAEIKKKEDDQNNFIKLEKEEKARLVKSKFKNLDAKIINNIIDGFIWIGMTDEMAVYSIGKPSSINTSVNKWTSQEQWVYSNLYLYFENGKLVSYQQSK